MGVRLLLAGLFFLHSHMALADKNFWWGVGHSAFQVEGSPEASDWLTWTNTPSKIMDGSNANRATNFWNSPGADFDAAQDLGATMFRLSIAWERIQPTENSWNEDALKRYQDIILQMRKRGLEPLVTLHHFVLPKWLSDKGGLLAHDFAEVFSRYADKVVDHLANGPAQVEWWMTFNEPMVLVTEGYVFGNWPPGQKSVFAGHSAAKSLVKAHNLVMSNVRSNAKLPKDLKWSLAFHYRDVEATGFGPLNPMAARAVDWIMNRWFLDQIDMSQLNYLGINYYGRTVVEFNGTAPFVHFHEGDGEKSDLGWVLHPQGLGEVLKDAFKHYKLPIIVSENGLADDDDSHRGQFIRDHIEEIRKVRSEGVPVIGYLHWSLTDNFEWAKGLTPRFGLIAMDYATGKRVPRSSYFSYQLEIKKGCGDLFSVASK